LLAGVNNSFIRETKLLADANDRETRKISPRAASIRKHRVDNDL
jgi:hypothetical protein